MLKKAALLWAAGWVLFGFPWTGLTARPEFENVNVVPFQQGYRPHDVALNFAYYVPLGAIGVSAGAGLWPTTIVATILSGTTEAIQIFSTDRFPSATDLVLNVSGALTGGALVRAWRRGRPRRASETSAANG